MFSSSPKLLAFPLGYKKHGFPIAGLDRTKTLHFCSHLIAFFPSGVDFLLLCFMHCAWLPKANRYSAVTYIEDDMAAEMHTKGLGL
jgi:hypothetical protein